MNRGRAALRVRTSRRVWPAASGSSTNAHVLSLNQRGRPSCGSYGRPLGTRSDARSTSTSSGSLMTVSKHRPRPCRISMSSSQTALGGASIVIPTVALDRASGTIPSPASRRARSASSRTPVAQARAAHAGDGSEHADSEGNAERCSQEASHPEIIRCVCVDCIGGRAHRPCGKCACMIGARSDAGGANRPHDGWMRKPILICYDGTSAARRAIEWAGSFLRGSDVVVLHLWDSPAVGGVFAPSPGMPRRDASEPLRSPTRASSLPARSAFSRDGWSWGPA